MKGKKSLTLFWLIFTFLVVSFLRLPSLFEPFTYGDEGVYLTLGLAIRRGLVLYKEIHDNKPPLLYLVAALSGSFASYRILFLAWSLVTLGAFFQLAKRIFPKNQKAVLVSAFVFAILANIHSFEGNIGNAENFMLLPTILGVLLIIPYFNDLSRCKTDLNRLFLAGIMFSVSTLFKVPAAFDFLAILIFLSFILIKKSRNQKFHFSLPTSHFSLLLGFLLPILITIFYFACKSGSAYYASRGTLNQYLTAAFLQNIPYLTSWGSGSQTQFSIFHSGLFWRGILLMAVSFLLFINSKKLSSNFLLATLWFSFSLFAALLSSRPYPHYLIQVIPSLSLLAAFILTSKIELEKLTALLSFFILIFSFLIFRFWYYLNFPYYQNFYQYFFGQKSKQQYFADFDKKANNIYQAAEFVVGHTLPEEKIFIWGNEPYLYALSRRLPVGRYTVAYHIIDFSGWEETFKAIEENQTKLIMTAPVAGHNFPALEELLEEKYIKIGEIGEYQFYHKISKLRSNQALLNLSESENQALPISNDQDS